MRKEREDINHTKEKAKQSWLKVPLINHKTILVTFTEAKYSNEAQIKCSSAGRKDFTKRKGENESSKLGFDGKSQPK